MKNQDFFNLTDNTLVFYGPAGIKTGFLADEITNVEPRGTTSASVTAKGKLKPFMTAEENIRLEYRKHPGRLRPYSVCQIPGAVEMKFSHKLGKAEMRLEGISISPNGELKSPTGKVLVTAEFQPVKMTFKPPKVLRDNLTEFIKATAEASWWRNNLETALFLISTKQANPEFMLFIVERLESGHIRKRFDLPWLDNVAPVKIEFANQDFASIAKEALKVIGGVGVVTKERAGTLRQKLLYNGDKQEALDAK